MQAQFPTTIYVYHRNKVELVLTLLNCVRQGKADVLVMWFIVPSYALAITMLAKMLRRKVVFITGGYDVAGIPELGFGAMRVPLFRRLLKPTLRLADEVLAFSDFSASEVERWVGFRPAYLRTLYFDIDAERFKLPPDLSAKERLAVTVCATLDQTSIRQKGVDSFVAAAEHLPDVQFVVVGKVSDDGAVARLRGVATPNVNFVGRLSNEELVSLYQRARVYVQISAHEGFGIAVAEAMCCGCIPVTTEPRSYMTSMPEVTGNSGYSVPYGDAKTTAYAIGQAMAADKEQQLAVRRLILSKFPKGRREVELVSHIKSLTRSVEERTMGQKVVIDLGCGNNKREGALGIDNRYTPTVSIISNATSIALRDNSVDEIYATCLLEHFDRPQQVLLEVHRVLKQHGRAIFRLPNIGTYSAHLDTTHRYLADLGIWKEVFKGFFSNIEVRPVGTKYRDSKLLRRINVVLVRGFKFYELAQGWDFICSGLKPNPASQYLGWWEEEH